MSNPYRQTYVIGKAGKLVEKDSVDRARSMTIIPDISPFQTQDGTPISSRVALREYERRTGTRQIGNDWPGSNKPQNWDSMIARQNRR